MNWIKAAGIRAIKTCAQTAIGVIGASYVMARCKLDNGRLSSIIVRDSININEHGRTAGSRYKG